ncbi:hypothetical protein GVN16_24245 [Emticicia sp. CRIBPO]|uniref:hypothetical protein n=1 Tax=Emticicia sp. CRIBPO TaxID=2683258 RepID=UPI00141365FC|nr:hypothetical protein [Emticicia sp. CRIBPO]NBA88908.1 hypothetical protein [Emticicia sp. CRIBPO]
MLKVIEIRNIKGIDLKRFELDIHPNKPSILVAPNGFGKSSLATAFNSMNNNRIMLNEDDYYKEDPLNEPKISIEYLRADGTSSQLEATNSSNTISSEIDYFVINNQTKPKGNASTFGGFANAKATLVIEDVVLIDRIPANTSFSYSFRNIQTQFGQNSKVLPNLKAQLTNLKLIEGLSQLYSSLEKANRVRIQEKINTIIEDINNQNGTETALIDWITANRLSDLKQIDHLKEIGNFISQLDIGYNSETKSYLAAIQLIWLYNQDAGNFKNACIYRNYLLDKERFDSTLTTFNSTWKNIRSSETGGKLIVRFPKAIQISNGQRDILTFISMLFKAKRKLRKPTNILIIDEVFDYLDDANLIAAQYYITTFIKEFDSSGRKIYPLILTHLNPNYFKNFAFSNQKVYYLDKSIIQVNNNIVRLLRKREDPTIKDDVAKYLLHYNNENINKRAEFRTLGIPELWGEGENFNIFLQTEVRNYLDGRVYCPFSVCGALRVKIEEIAFNKLQSAESKTTFLETKKTRNKLEKVEDMGFISPESHYLLGIIYNEGMHWKENHDNVSPVASKLENLTIKKLIQDIFI